ncbi:MULTISPECIES: alpha/beta hydrolase [unclassified Caballeronia]|uniref:alpha/beta fold hydrolase n=1 Tax=unclassified Caballeronia TaxID=2646786 RepID=UPI00286373D0|nr:MULTISPECIES: alpha/beta hydrolase [unclassified Caballeronia]MDR5740636.1 alpha/beta hydrolase [Caballeronia sp. LZ016]MDR5808841.1 alpha/beta hydrolase [Caballeronia sp. LZ019]
MNSQVQFARLNCGSYPLSIEYQWINADRSDAPVVLFLHEGLGSIALWKDWPQSLCDRLGCRGVVYSRPGYGRSTPRSPAERWPVEFLHHQAQVVLPAFLDAIGIDDAERARMWLVGHSDGGSIALLYASAFPEALAGAAVLAPHTFVEPTTVDAITQTRNAYEHTGLRAKLMQYHEDVDSAFYGWNDAWLNPAFRHWNIADELGSIMRPLLAIQGREDEYATMEQIDRIKVQVPHAQLVKLPHCGHTPHRDAASAVNDAIADFFGSHQA